MRSIFSSEGETTCSTPAVANSVTSGGNVSVYRVGDNVTVTCGQGFQLDGAKQITCGSDGKWQPDPPRCLPSPEKTTEMLDSPGTFRFVLVRYVADCHHVSKTRPLKVCVCNQTLVSPSSRCVRRASSRPQPQHEPR